MTNQNRSSNTVVLRFGATEPFTNIKGQTHSREPKAHILFSNFDTVVDFITAGQANRRRRTDDTSAEALALASKATMGPGREYDAYISPTQLDSQAVTDTVSESGYAVTILRSGETSPESHKRFNTFILATLAHANIDMAEPSQSTIE